MGVLKKLRASSLMETLVATVLIVVTFMIASMVLNNLFVTSISGNSQNVRQQLYAIQYQYKHGHLELPHSQQYGDWQIEVISILEEGIPQVVYTAKHEGLKKEVTMKMSHGED